jgi:hypothetical protein
MIDSLKHTFENSYSDQVPIFASDSSVVNDTLSFVANGADVYINPQLIINNQNPFVGLVLLLLMFLIAAIWYFSPDSLTINFKSLTANSFRRNWEKTGNKSGLVINSLLYLNFLVVSSLLVFMVINNFLFDLLNISVEWNSFYMIVLGIVLFVLLRYIFIKLSGFVFQTFEMAYQQNKLYNSMEKGLGLISLPLLLASLYINLDLFLYLSIGLFILFVISRWGFTIVIGIRTSKFSWFHIILYLCTLEIIPLMFLLKILENQIFKVL